VTILSFVLFIFLGSFLLKKKGLKYFIKASDRQYFLFSLLALYPVSLLGNYAQEGIVFLMGINSFALFTCFLRIKYINDTDEPKLAKRKSSVLVKLPLLGGFLFLSLYHMIEMEPQKILWIGFMFTFLINGYYKFVEFTKSLLSFYILIGLWTILYLVYPILFHANMAYIPDAIFGLAFALLLNGVIFYDK